MDNEYVSVIPEDEPEDECAARRLVRTSLVDVCIHRILFALPVKALHRDGYSRMMSSRPDMDCHTVMTPEQSDKFYSDMTITNRSFEVTELCSIIPPNSDWDLKPQEYGYLTVCI